MLQLVFLESPVSGSLYGDDSLVAAPGCGFGEARDVMMLASAPESRLLVDGMACVALGGCCEAAAAIAGAGRALG